jgi:hypothetical protein
MARKKAWRPGEPRQQSLLDGSPPPTHTPTIIPTGDPEMVAFNLYMLLDNPNRNDSAKRRIDTQLRKTLVLYSRVDYFGGADRVEPTAENLQRFEVLFLKHVDLERQKTFLEPRRLVDARAALAAVRELRATY